MSRMARITGIVLMAWAALQGSPRANALVITPIFDSTITNDANAATIEGTINSAIAVLQNTFSNNITVKINFKEMSTGLGQSETYVNTISYQQFINAFSSETTTAAGQLALAHLPNTANNPVNGSTTIDLTTANLRALGFNTAADFPPTGQPDSFIGLNTSIMNIDRLSINANRYDLIGVVTHEMDEALGLFSTLDGLSNGAASPTGAIGVMDLYRYDSTGNRTFTTSAFATSYFSLNGTTRIEQFNQNANGDFHDWVSQFTTTPQVQEAFGTPGSTPNLGTPEITALEAAGYNAAVVPEPTSFALLALGLPIAAYVLHKRRGRSENLSA